MRKLPAMHGGSKIGMFVVYRSKDEDGPWDPLHRDSVPEWIKDDPEVMGLLKNGHMVQNASDDPRWFYIATEQPLDAISH